MGMGQVDKIKAMSNGKTMKKILFLEKPQFYRLSTNYCGYIWLHEGQHYSGGNSCKHGRFLYQIISIKCIPKTKNNPDIIPTTRAFDCSTSLYFSGYSLNLIN
jgi:hypothetical protein